MAGFSPQSRVPGETDVCRAKLVAEVAILLAATRPESNRIKFQKSWKMYYLTKLKVDEFLNI